MSRARVFVHEQNSVPGKLNKLIGRQAHKVLLTFPETAGFFPANGVVVGYPVRQSVTRTHGQGRPLPVSIPEGRRVVFAFGGSQGARTINRAVVDALAHLRSHRHDIFVVHGVGLMSTRDYHAWEDTAQRLLFKYTDQARKEISSFYYAQEYFHNIGDIYAVSDLIVCRGGAGSLNEISAMGKPALIIPKANLPEDHQVMNARAMKRAKAAELIFEDTVMEKGILLEKVEGSVLAAKILSMLDAPSHLVEMGNCSRAFMKHDVLERISSEIYENGLPQDSEAETPAVELDPLMSNNEILQLLRHVWQKGQEQYEPQLVIRDPDDLDYYRHRAASLLTSPSWPERNLGVKLIGLLKHEEKLSSLVHLLNDRTPANKLQRLLGGDYRQVGFIRRNILAALQIINQWGQEVEARAYEALDDRYYEVRVQAARTMAHFSDRLIQRQAITERLLALLKDRSFEVVKEVALALGHVGSERNVAQRLLALKEHHYWQVREAALRAVARLVRRGVVSDRRWLLTELSHFILTTTDFRPHFGIKETYGDLFELCREEEDN
jgi:UDP-N-acetylglucosamine--N-acetylmuramyl-(pentapeptide) pyrophosphoryl-undecaprenol N-acetylglucosamine transferase